jgi:hypothetical protein
MPLTAQQTVYLQSGNPETENVQTLAYPGQLGNRFTAKVGGLIKGYQLVKLDATSAQPAAAAVAWWSDEENYVVTTNPATLGRARVAGVLQFAITPGWYGCMQIDGRGRVKLLTTPTAAPVANSGQYLTPSATAGQADCLAVAASPTYPPVGLVAGALDGPTNTVLADIIVGQNA